MAIAYCVLAATWASPAQAQSIAAFDPAAIAKIGITYARYRFDLSRALLPNAATASVSASPSPLERRTLGFHFSSSVDDAVRDRIVALFAGGDPAQSAATQQLFGHDALLDQATGAIRVLGLHETDLADIATALVIVSYDATHPVAFTFAQSRALARAVRVQFLASPALATLDDPTKQTIATEMAYQTLFFESDASAYGYGRDAAATAKLHASIAATLATLGVNLAAVHPDALVL